MGLWLILLAVLVWLVLLRPMAGHYAYIIARADKHTAPNREDWWLAGFCACLWPVFVPCWVCYKVGRWLMRKQRPIGAEARALAEGRQRYHEREVAARERAVARAEQELNIGDLTEGLDTSRTGWVEG